MTLKDQFPNVTTVMLIYFNITDDTIEDRDNFFRNVNYWLAEGMRVEHLAQLKGAESEMRRLPLDDFFDIILNDVTEDLQRKWWDVAPNMNEIIEELSNYGNCSGGNPIGWQSALM